MRTLLLALLLAGAARADDTVQGTSGPRVMIDAHMDELGGVVRRVTPEGWLSMQMLGGWLDQALVDQRWTILGSKGPVRAITGVRDIHIASQDERTKVIPREQVSLDVGAKNAAEVAALGLAPGDPVAPEAPFAELKGTQNYLGKAWDDPEVGIAIEGGVTRDAPGVHPEEAQELLGGGPAMFLYDSSALPNRKLVELVRQTAREKNLPLQTDLVQGYGDDSAEMQKAGGGAPTINIVVPVRFTHSHNGIINRQDFDQTVELLVALLTKLDAKTVAELRSF
jgi:endoglucanase